MFFEQINLEVKMSDGDHGQFFRKLLKSGKKKEDPEKVRDRMEILSSH